VLDPALIAIAQSLCYWRTGGANIKAEEQYIARQLEFDLCRFQRFANMLMFSTSQTHRTRATDSSRETNIQIEGADDNEVEVSAQRIQNRYIAAVTSIDHIFVW